MSLEVYRPDIFAIIEMSIAPWQEPARGDYPDPRSFGLTGREIARLVAAGVGVPPPITRLMGLQWTEAEDDHTAFTLPGVDWFLSSQEHISVGPLLVLADAAFGSALMLDLPAATPFTTWELSMSFLKPCPPGGTIRAAGYPLHNGRPLAITEVWIEDGNGERVAHGTSANMVLPQLEGFEHPGDDLPDYVIPPEETPDPWERPAMGETIPWEIWRTMPGLEILGRQIKGDLPQPPIHYLTGMTLREVAEGQVTFTMPASKWLTSPARTMQGGTIAMLAHAALTTAVTSTLEAGAAYRPVDVKVNFLRPGIADGRDLSAHGSVLHRGRTLAVALADVVNSDGKKVATATGSVIILPERPEG
jgi:uncharacterized protein (TIGR00369 family)